MRSSSSHAWRAQRRAPSSSRVIEDDFHGDVTRVDPTATAYPHRDQGHNLPADDHDLVRQAYGVNDERRVELKRRYDPGNLFQLNQNIDPSRAPPAVRPGSARATAM
jgi:hypothetical protein